MRASVVRDPEEYDAIAKRVREGGLAADGLRSLLAELQGEKLAMPVLTHSPDEWALAVAALAGRHAVIGRLEIPPELVPAVEPSALALAQQPVTRASLTAFETAIAGAIEQVALDRAQLVQDEKEVRRLTVHADLLDAYMQLLNDLLDRRKTEELKAED